MFKTDVLNNSNYYFLNNQNITLLFERMLAKFKKKKGEILLNHYVKHIKYVRDNFVLYCNNDKVFNCNYIVTTISKKNLLNFNFWNNTQIKHLNSVFSIPILKTKKIFDNILKSEKDLLDFNNFNSENQILLDTMHIVFPSTSKRTEVIYLWQNNVNNIILREKIKHLYNKKFFICSESFSKNNLFINYSLEFVDNCVISL